MDSKNDQAISTGFMATGNVLIEKLGIDSGFEISKDNADKIFCALVVAIVKVQEIEESLRVYGKHLPFCPLSLNNSGQQCACNFDVKKAAAHESLAFIYSCFDDDDKSFREFGF